MGARTDEGGGPSPPGSSQSLLAVGLRTLGFRSIALIANLVNGVIIARALGGDGRGAFAAASIGPSVAGILFSAGCLRSVSYFQARRTFRGADVIGTWVAVILILATAGCLLLQLLLPTLLAAQSGTTVDVARIWSLSLFIALSYQLGCGMLLGDHRFDLYNVLGVMQQVCVTLGTAALWAAGRLTVDTAFAAAALGFGLGAVLALGAAVHRHGIARPRLPVARETVAFGVKTQGADVGTSTNARLDTLVLPAYLPAASVGYYSVASNVAWVIVTLIGSLAPVVLPTAAREAGASDVRKIVGTLHLTVIAGTALALAAGVIAPVGLPLLYGDEFSRSVTALWILLPGTVLFAGAQILLAGLYARARPALSLAVQVPALVVTIGGMALVLPGGGLTGAAAVSTAALALMFAASAALYQRTTDVPWRYMLYPRDVWSGLRMRLRTRAA